MLEDFQTDTASMARKRHPASTARGFIRFLSCTQYPQANPLTPSYPWQNRNPEDGSLSPGVGNLCGSRGAYFLLPTAAILLCGFPSASRADQTGGEVQAGKLACMDEHHYLAARA